jgi:hypothetical protein
MFSCMSKKAMTKGVHAPVKDSSVALPPPPPPNNVDNEEVSLLEQEYGVGGSVKETKGHKVVIKSNQILIEEYKNQNKGKTAVKRHATPQPSAGSQEGQILYQIPDSMKIGKISEVFVRISSVKGALKLTQNVTGTVQTSVIKVSETMEVELIDPSLESFKIVQNNKGVQIIDNDSSYTEWRWDVTPLKAGNKSLKLVVSIIKGGNTKQTVYVDNVIVKSNAVYQTEGFFEKYWQWLCSTIIIPFIVWLWKKRRKEE